MRIRNLLYITGSNESENLEAHQIALKRAEHTHIHILPRASADCFLLELEHIKLLCKKDRCVVLEPKVIKYIKATLVHPICI